MFSLAILIFSNLLVNILGSGLKDLELDGSVPTPPMQLDGTNFYIYRRKLTWDQAYEYCHTCVGSFATFPTVEAANLIRNKIYNISTFSDAYDNGKVREEFGLDRRYWFGLRDQIPTEGEWVWVDNPSNEGKSVPLSELKLYPWYPNQPDHKCASLKDGEHCVGFWNPGYHWDKFKVEGKGNQERHTFNDMSCDRKYYFICQKSSPPPAYDDQCKFLELGLKLETSTSGNKTKDSKSGTVSEVGSNAEEKKVKTRSDSAEIEYAKARGLKIATANDASLGENVTQAAKQSNDDEDTVDSSVEETSDENEIDPETQKDKSVVGKPIPEPSVKIGGRQFSIKFLKDILNRKRSRMTEKSVFESFDNSIK